MAFNKPRCGAQCGGPPNENSWRSFRRSPRLTQPVGVRFGFSSGIIPHPRSGQTNASAANRGLGALNLVLLFARFPDSLFSWLHLALINAAIRKVCDSGVFSQCLKGKVIRLAEPGALEVMDGLAAFHGSSDFRTETTNARICRTLRLVPGNEHHLQPMTALSLH